jgi:predicted dehydrogenase
MASMSHSRRFFLGCAAAWPVLGANDRITAAIIGMGGRGTDHIQAFLTQPGVRLGAVCDVDQASVERAQAAVVKAAGYQPKGYRDMRDLLADKEVDVVSVATPNHWHALATIWAVQAGKDVYVEKPASHNPWEGDRMVDAARKYKRIVQVGLQSRSMPHKRRAMELLAQGAIGEVFQGRALVYKRRKSIGHKADSPVPPGVDWDRFLGPAPLRPFNELRFKYNWHWFWDTGNGEIGNNGPHQIDVARWGMRLGIGQTTVSTGGKYVYRDDQETPNTQTATFGYGGKEIVCDVRGFPTGGEGSLAPSNGVLCANLFFGSDGYLALDDEAFRVFKGEKVELEVPAEPGDETAPHFANFLKAVRSRDHRDLNADVEDGVLSTNLCHFANISYRLGRGLRYDAAAHRFVDDPVADRLLTRPYRAPYVVPDRV